VILLHIIIILLAGGAIAWWSERLGEHWPRLIAITVVLIDLVYLLSHISQIPATQLSLVPTATEVQSWLVSYQADWIPRFGISLILAMDGMSLFSGHWLVWLGYFCRWICSCSFCFGKSCWYPCTCLSQSGGMKARLMPQ